MCTDCVHPGVDRDVCGGPDDDDDGGGGGGGCVQIVFIPVWIVMCVALVGVIYAVILAVILLRSSDIVPEQRRGSTCSAIGYTCFIIPLLVFEVGRRLHNHHQ